MKAKSKTKTKPIMDVELDRNNCPTTVWAIDGQTALDQDGFLLCFTDEDTAKRVMGREDLPGKAVTLTRDEFHLVVAAALAVNGMKKLLLRKDDGDYEIEVWTVRVEENENN